MSRTTRVRQYISAPCKRDTLRPHGLFLGYLAVASLGLISVTKDSSAQYLGRDLVVSQVGTGSAALSSAGTAVILDDYNTSGVLQKKINLPTADSGANHALVSSGTATSEGALTLSGDGQYLVYTGYDAAPGTTGVATGTAARVIARIDANGNVNTTTALTDAYSGGNIRSAVTQDGTTFWMGGSNAGVRYTTLGSTTSTSISTTITNVRDVNIALGQLYATSASGSFVGVSMVGTGVPTTSGQALTLLPGFSNTLTASPYDYVVASPNVIYLADDGSSTSTGGLQKWVLSNGVWTLDYRITSGLAGGLRGLTASVDGGITTLYAVTTETSANKLVSFTDPLTASSNSSAFVVVATAPTNTAFRGVDFAPKAIPAPAATPEPGAVAAAVIAGGLLTTLRRRKAKRK